ncbi:GroES-like protein [Aureobasidium pullulans]|nr:GroES-like protein [Aureobasidium pullulans]
MSTIMEHPRTIGLSQIENEVSDSQNNSNATEEKVRRADSPLENGLPFQQNIALLHAARERLVYTQDYPVPLPKTDDELVVEIRAIGLNPVDWKSMYTCLPYSFQMQLTRSTVITTLRSLNYLISQAAILLGWSFAHRLLLVVCVWVICPSTDYRDIRKSAFQEYAISTQHNVAKLPQNVPTTHGASIGVAYVAAALALGVSLGLNLPKVSGQDDAALWEAVRKLPQDAIPIDVAAECLSSIENHERPQQGDWIAIYGGSSTSALFISEIARLAGLKVILLADSAKHGERLGEREGSILVDSHDPIRAINVVRAITKGKLRFAVDTVGKETAGHLVQMLQADAQEERRAHLVGLTGVPKEKVDGIVFHSVPIKLFHEVPSIGLTLMTWLEKALETQAIALPEVEHAGGGLEGINAALDRMRNGEISGRRLVISV